MPHRITNSWPARGLILAAVISLAACAAGPTGTAGSTKTAKKNTTGAKVASPKTSASKASTVTASPSPTPKPIPSLGLLLTGKVTVDPAALLTNKLAEKTATGVKLISDNGLGLISDNGLGLISDNGLGLISDNGLGLIANNSAGFRVQQATSSLKSVQGMWVKAISLYDGKVLAGPVATQADGSYKLGFINVPSRNIRIVAGLPDAVADARFAYSTLVPPKPATILTSDSTRAVSRYILGVLPARIQPWIDLAKAGTPDLPDEDDSSIERELKELFLDIPVDVLKAADQNGSMAMGVSERLVSFADLTLPVYHDFFLVTEEVRAFGDTLTTQPTEALVDQVVKLAGDKVTARQIPALLESYGMAPAEAAALHARLNAKGAEMAQVTSLALMLHQKEIFAPVVALKKK